MKVELKNLTKKFDDKTALDDVNLVFKNGCVIGLIGPNGSGKTTLMKLLNGLIIPTSGEISFDGNPVGVYSKQRISYLPDKNYINGRLTVNQVLDLFNGFYDDFNMEKANRLLDELELPRNQRIKTLSKGTKAKVQLVFVMSRDAELYLLDEPIGGVDPVVRDYILETIISNYNENATVIISTHLIQEVENFLDEVIMINDGRIGLVDSVDNIREKHGKSVDQMFKEVVNS